MKRFKILILVFTSLSFFSLADSESQTTTNVAKYPAPRLAAPKMDIDIDSITIIYRRVIDSNRVETESRIRTYVKRILSRATNSDTSKTKISIR